MFTPKRDARAVGFLAACFEDKLNDLIELLGGAVQPEAEPALVDRRLRFACAAVRAWPLTAALSGLGDRFVGREPTECVRLDLSHAFARDAELLADLLQRVLGRRRRARITLPA